MCAAVPKPKSDTHRKSVSPSVVNRGARNTAEGKPFVPDLARHRKESAMRGRKRRLVRHQRIWRATMKCCASTFAYALTGPFSGNASRRDLDAGRGVPVPENDTCGPTTPTQHEQRLAMNLSSRAIAARRKPLLQNRARTAWSHRLIPDGAFQCPQSTLAVVLPTLGACNAAHAICGGPSSRKRTSWPRGSAVSDGDLRTSPSCRLDAVSRRKACCPNRQRAILPG